MALNINLVIPIFITSTLPHRWVSQLPACRRLLPRRLTLTFIFTLRRNFFVGITTGFCWAHENRNTARAQLQSSDCSPMHFKEQQSALSWMTFLCSVRYRQFLSFSIYPEADFCPITQFLMNGSITIGGMNIRLPVKVTCSQEWSKQD